MLNKSVSPIPEEGTEDRGPAWGGAGSKQAWLSNVPKTQVRNQGTETVDVAVAAKRLKAVPVHEEMGKVAARVEPKGDGTETGMLPSSQNRMVTENRGTKGETQR